MNTTNRIQKDINKLKTQIIELIETTDDPFKNVYKCLYSKINTSDQSITKERYDYIKQIFLSINQQESQRDTNENIIIWPTNKKIQYKKTKIPKLLNLLISYSQDLDVIENLRHSINWEKLSQLSELDILMNEFFEQKTISVKTIEIYKSNLNAQLLMNLYEIEENEYCNRNKIKMFFNEFNDRFKQISDDWSNIANDLSIKYPINFCIVIPKFHPFDIISLVFDPFSKTKGCIFKNIKCSPEIINKFSELYDEIMKTKSKQTFKYVYDNIESIVIEYTKKLYRDEIKEYFDINDFQFFYKKVQENDKLRDLLDIFDQVNKVLKIIDSIISNETDLCNLDFSDVTKIDFEYFNSFIDENPPVGFYLSQFPEIKQNIEKIIDIVSKEKNSDDKLPLSLFLFRIFSRIDCIQFQIKEYLPPKLEAEFQEFVHNQIITNLKNFNQFSNFIPFLLSNPPYFYKNTSYSDYVRSFTINLLLIEGECLSHRLEILNSHSHSHSQSPLYVFLPKLFEILGSVKWKDIICQELQIKSKNDIIHFLTYPLEPYINKNSISTRKIANMIDSFLAEKSIKELRNCIIKDEEDLLIGKKENFKELNMLWDEYCKYVNAYLNKIPFLTDYSYNMKSSKVSSYEKFHQFFSNELNHLSSRYCEIIVIIPDESDSQEYEINYFYLNKRKYRIINKTKGKVMLFRLPKNTTVESLDLHCNGAKYLIDIIYCDFDVEKAKYPSVKSIVDKYNKFDNLFKEILEKEGFLEKNIQQIILILKKDKVLFDGIYFDEFIEEMSLIEQNFMNDIPSSDLCENNINGNILKLKQMATISYSKNKLEKPKRSIQFFSENYINDKINLYNSNLVLVDYNSIEISSSVFQRFQYEFKKYITYIIFPKLNFQFNNIESMENLLTPSIFRINGELYVTVKEINIVANSLFYDVDTSPLLIKFDNFIDEQINCEIIQTNGNSISPKCINEGENLIIEFPVESISKTSFNESNNERKIFFDGFITLSTIYNTKSLCKIDFHILLNYLPSTVYLKIKNNHFFMYNNGSAEIVPFIAELHSKLHIEKFTIKKIKKFNLTDNILELNDNEERKPQFSSKHNDNDERIIDITTIFEKKNYNEESYLSMNFDLGVKQNKTIQIPLHIHLIPSLEFSLFCEQINDFSDKDIIINIGNLKRRVYFVVRATNYNEDLIIPKVEFKFTNIYINAEFNYSKNTNTIQPDQIGYAIYYFEVRYTGNIPDSEKDLTYDGSISATINSLSKTQSFKYKIVANENKERNFVDNTNINKFYYYNIKNDSIKECDLKTINDYKNHQNSEKFILISPFNYCYYDASYSIPRIIYNFEDGTISQFFYDNKKSAMFEILEYSHESKEFIIIEADNPKEISINDKNTYILARLKNEPKSFFPLFCPPKCMLCIENKNFNILNYQDLHVYSRLTDYDLDKLFFDFYINMMETNDRNIRMKYGNYKNNSLFNETDLPKIYNFSFIIHQMGKEMDNIQFIDAIQIFEKFCETDSLKKHFQKSTQTSNWDNFYSFISALNELANKRFDEINICNFYLKSPIPFDKIVEKQTELFQKYIANEEKLENTSFISGLRSFIQKCNEREKNEIEKFARKGMKITQVLKWTEKEGLVPSTIEEYDKQKELIFPVKNEINVKIVDENLKKAIKNIENFDEFSISSIYNILNDILIITYHLPSMIYSLIKNNQPLDIANRLLYQIINIYRWKDKCSQFFPFPLFIQQFNTAFTSMIGKLNGCKLEIPYFSEKDLLNNSDFVQFPGLVYKKVILPSWKLNRKSIQVPVKIQPSEIRESQTNNSRKTPNEIQKQKKFKSNFSRNDRNKRYYGNKK